MVAEFQEWLESLDQATYNRVMAAADILGEEGPSLGRPLVDTVKSSRYSNMKELRPPSPGRTTIRVLFAFDPDRQAILLVGGDKTNDWEQWYRRNVPLADALFGRYLAERGERKGGR